MNNLHTGERLETCYFDGTNYVGDEMARLSNHAVTSAAMRFIQWIRTRLIVITQIQNVPGIQKEVQIISWLPFSSDQ
ncbi:hypothetical protein O9993_10655 [Vibrio lentus]|nr:hypothetical protein [Vibrio lentus]